MQTSVFPVGLLQRLQDQERLQLLGNTNSTLYMWEPAANEDFSEFENDFIASTNEFVLTNKVMQRYESDYFRSNQLYPGELSSRAHHMIRRE